MLTPPTPPHPKVGYRVRHGHPYRAVRYGRKFVRYAVLFLNVEKTAAVPYSAPKSWVLRTERPNRTVVRTTVPFCIGTDPDPLVSPTGSFSFEVRRDAPTSSRKIAVMGNLTSLLGDKREGVKPKNDSYLARQGQNKYIPYFFE